MPLGTIVIQRKGEKMKKFIQVSLVVVVSLALVFGLLLYTDGNSLAGGGVNSCRVGWNTRTGSCLASKIWFPGDDNMPNVGWNSGISAAPSQDLALGSCTTRLCTNVGWNS